MRKKKRTPANQKKHERLIWRAINALGCPDDLITNFNRLRSSQHKEVLERSNPNWKADTALLHKSTDGWASLPPDGLSLLAQ